MKQEVRSQAAAASSEEVVQQKQVKRLKGLNASMCLCTHIKSP